MPFYAAVWLVIASVGAVPMPSMEVCNAAKAKLLQERSFSMAQMPVCVYGGAEKP